MIARRTFLRGSAAMPIAGALPAAASVLSADVVLIAQANALRLFRAREVAAWAALPDDHPDDFPPYVACGALAEDVRMAGEALAEVVAVTAAGLAAKASAMLALVGRGSDAGVEAFTEHHALVASVLRDAARIGTGAAHG